MKTSEQTDKIAPAWVAMQKALQPAIKDATNPAFRSKYADLAAVADAAYPAMHAHGLGSMQDVTTTDSGVEVTTRILHDSGQWFEFGPLTVPLSKRDAHGVGSATTYGRRFGLSAAVGVVPDDDDGNAAVESKPAQAPPQARPTAPPQRPTQPQRPASAAGRQTPPQPPARSIDSPLGPPLKDSDIPF